MKNKKPVVVSLIALSLLLTACGDDKAKEAPVRPVRLTTIGESNVSPVVQLAGEVRARVESRLGFRVGGKILTRRVEAGQRVRRGDELARLDARDFQLAGQAAKAQQAAAQAQLDNARAELRRYEELSQKGYVSATDLERRRVELTAAEAAMQQATSGQALEGNRLEDTILRADADGVVVEVLADAGEVVGTGQPVIRLAQDGVREIEVEFPEDRTALARMATAEVTLWAQPGKKYPATLRELSAAADPVTRTFRARYSVQAPANMLALGQSASVNLRVPSMGKGARLPTTALLGEGQSTRVWVFDEKTETVKAHPVVLAGIDGNDVMVAGLPIGARVVTAGVHVLAEGQKVRPYTAR
ncbi:MAG: efflux RND transporter periplasmic adaptor subunit [Moraxellaceae bacterium]|nr:efflux RND transporter periplasmic adaptor subunit [Moraxellaceae bacterium]